MSEYTNANRVAQIATRLITEHHKHLGVANIAYVFKTSGEVNPKITERRKGKVEQIAKTKLQSELNRYLSGFHFVLEVDESLWDLLGIEHQEALIDHSLAEMGWDEKGPYLKDCTIREFPEIIERHGLWTEQLKKFGEAFRQLNLFEAPEEVSVEEKASVN